MAVLTLKKVPSILEISKMKSLLAEKLLIAIISHCLNVEYS